jgi:hypothetical protein
MLTRGQANADREPHRPLEQNKDGEPYTPKGVSTVRGGGHAMPSGLTVPTLLTDRIRLWKEGVRDRVMERCCALHTFRVRLTPWQPMV